MPSKIVFLTGSGLSADSGLRTFRGADGLYSGMRGEDIMKAGTLRSNPSLVHALADDMRQSFGKVDPNDAHRMVARVAAAGGENVTVITQNIDDLLERAGASGVVHLHGFGTRLRSIANPRFTTDVGYTRYWSGPEEEAPPGGYQFRCPVTNARYRPDVVLFDEDAAMYPRMRKAIRALGRDDLLVVIGTRLEIGAVADAVAEARCRTVLNNLHDDGTIDLASFDEVILDRATNAAPRIEELCMAALGKSLGPGGLAGN